MQVTVYRNGLKAVFVEAGTDSSALPAEVQSAIQNAKETKQIDLTPEQPRVGVNVKEAIADIESKGYHLAEAEIRIESHVVPNK